MEKYKEVVLMKHEEEIVLEIIIVKGKKYKLIESKYFDNCNGCSFKEKDCELDHSDKNYLCLDTKSTIYVPYECFKDIFNGLEDDKNV